MITCLGLVVGLVESELRQDVLNQCAKWLKTYKHLLDLERLNFVIDGKVYFTVIDSFIDGNEVLILCKMHDGWTSIGTSKSVC